MADDNRQFFQRPYRYEARSGDRVIGYLTETAVDQPWILCDFTPGPAWAEVGPVFARMNRALAQQFVGEYRGAMAAYRELGVWFHPADGGEAIQPSVVWVDGAVARYRH